MKERRSVNKFRCSKSIDVKIPLIPRSLSESGARILIGGFLHRCWPERKKEQPEGTESRSVSEVGAPINLNNNTCMHYVFPMTGPIRMAFH